ncbi:MAG: hypothetical protein E7294_00700 [Lachnospiraceae bacterium]|nr:hypothetical protein [Lachnospiraceae bacterium]
MCEIATFHESLLLGCRCFSGRNMDVKERLCSWGESVIIKERLWSLVESVIVKECLWSLTSGWMSNSVAQSGA